MDVLNILHVFDLSIFLQDGPSALGFQTEAWNARGSFFGMFV